MPKKPKVNSYFEEQREAAHRSLDRLFETEAKTLKLRGKNNKVKRLQIAAAALDDLVSLGRLFQLTILSLIEPLTPSARDDEKSDGSVPVNEWRDAAAFLISHRIPMQDPMGRTLSSALSALNLGEIQGVVRASVTGKRGRAWAISRLQMAALVHTYFLVGQGYRVGEALRRVAEAYGYHENGANTVRSWGTRELKRVFGTDYLNYMKKMAIEAGRFHRNGSIYEREHKPENLHVSFFATLLERSSLKTCADLYKASLQGQEVVLPRWLDNAG